MNFEKMVSVSVAAFFMTTGASLTASATEKRSKFHCEKTVGGNTVDLKEVKSRKECKTKGGKWTKGHHGHAHEDGHNHENEDGHKHNQARLEH